MSGPAAFVLQGGWPLTLARVSFVAGLLSLGGALVFRGAVAPRAFERMGSRDVTRARLALARGITLSLVVACLGLIAWTVAESAQIAGTDGLAATTRVIWPVLAHTSFGHVVLVQATLLLATSMLLTTGLAVLPALVCVGAEAAHGHGMAMGGVFAPLFQLEMIHVLAASVWIGGLLPLLTLVRLAPPKAAAVAARWFSPIGKWAVGLLAAAAALQGAWLVGSFRALGHTAYGAMVLTKITLFLVLLGFALLNRYALAPRLTGAEPVIARRRLLACIAMQSGVGLLTVAAAVVLSGLAPGIDAP